jgi:spermidine synthase
MRFARPVRNESRGENATAWAWVSNGARVLLIFSYGLFTIAAQTLLFREFITTFEGNDISVGIFFGSWFLWVGLAAILVYRAKAFAQKLLANVEFLFLAYLPAFVLQTILIIQARQLAGVEAYALLPIRTQLVLSILLNAPVSIITGMLFPVACRWVRQGRGLAVSRVYILEAAGSFVGGLGATVLLGFGLSLARAFFILALIISSSTFFVQLAGKFPSSRQPQNQLEPHTAQSKPGFTPLGLVGCILSFLLSLSACLALAFEVDKTLMRYIRVVKWTKLLPADALTGSFQTALREGSTCEVLPDRESAGRIAAISLCQNPNAGRVLVIGSGLGLCREFLRLPQIEQVTWTHCDYEYVRKVDGFIPPQFKINDERFDRLAGDVRPLLAQKRNYYDLIILNLPEATSSVLNRYYTLEFYRQVKDALRAEGLFSVRVAGGENIMGTELINLGASTKLTLEKVFSQLVLTPGEDTWFIASDSDSLTGDPGTVRERFAAIEGAAEVFPPDALLSVYLPDRAASALESYSTADLPEGLLINRDSRPLTHLYSLLLAAKQSGAPIARFIKHLALAGLLPFLVPILVVIILRVIYVSSGTMLDAHRAKTSIDRDIHNTLESAL